MRDLVENELLLYERLYAELFRINMDLWAVVDKQYCLERQGMVNSLDFANTSYQALDLNRKRFSVKAIINSISGSEIAEQKQFGD